MTIVVGQIEPLKRLKNFLTNHGISRFHSIGEINTFINNYAFERKEIPTIVERTLYEEINELQSDIDIYQNEYDDIKRHILNELNQDLQLLEESIKHSIEKSNKNILTKIFYYPKIKIQSIKRLYLENNLEKSISKKTYTANQKISLTKNKLENMIKNKDSIILSQCADFYNKLDSTKELVDGLYSLIAGAIGENSTVNELQKLTDDYYLINDFSLEFNPPIFNRGENDKIFSIQIDHLLISQSGVYLLETKNWSKKTIKSLDLRSPVDQIRRTSYALFVLLNSESNNLLVSHHWGSKKIPIRNIIVMTNEKPKEEFKHVKVLSLHELNSYIKYFDEIFSKSEVENIFNYLKNENQ
jgi:hypothetical protein